jgi:hypothetical protein
MLARTGVSKLWRPLEERERGQRSASKMMARTGFSKLWRPLEERERSEVRGQAPRCWLGLGSASSGGPWRRERSEGRGQVIY